MTAPTISTDPKAVLKRYLQSAREAAVWKLDGVSEYDLRRPMVPTGTNLLGVIRHLTGVEAGYFGEVFDRPWPDAESFDFDSDPNADLWVGADQGRDEVIERYRAVWVQSDATIDELSLGDTGTVPWWGDNGDHVTLHTLLVHVIAETNRHGGQLDILREQIDGGAGLRKGGELMWLTTDDERAAHYARVERAARDAAGTAN